MTDWLTTKEAATYAKVSPDAIRDAVARGDLTAWKVNANAVRPSYRHTTEALDAWLEKGRTGVIPTPRPLRRTA